MNALPSIAVIGGTGALGTGLVRRWALAGHTVFIGSRNPESAHAAAEECVRITAERGVVAHVSGLENASAASAADIVVLAVPYAQHGAVLDHVHQAVQGKIVLDTTVPLMPPKVGTVQLPAGGAAALATQARLGPDVRVVSAFQTVAADKLQSAEPLEGDVLVCGNSKDDCAVIISLVEAIGMRGFYAGPLANSAASEALTSVLITINRQFKCHAGIKIVGIG